jgi:TPR repeat protein
MTLCPQIAASMGHAEAMFKAGKMHEEAQGTHPDLFVAADFYHSAALLGHLNGQAWYIPSTRIRLWF